MGIICFAFFCLVGVFVYDIWNSQYMSVKYFGSGELAFSQVTSFQQGIPNLPWTLLFELKTLPLLSSLGPEEIWTYNLLPLDPEDGKENQEVRVTKLFHPGDFCLGKESAPGLMTKTLLEMSNAFCVHVLGRKLWLRLKVIHQFWSYQSEDWTRGSAVVNWCRSAKTYEVNLCIFILHGQNCSIIFFAIFKVNNRLKWTTLIFRCLSGITAIQHAGKSLRQVSLLISQALSICEPNCSNTKCLFINHRQDLDKTPHITTVNNSRTFMGTYKQDNIEC